MPVDIHDCHNFGQANEGQPHCAVVVEEGQPVLAGAGGEDQTNREAKEASGTCAISTDIKIKLCSRT